MVIFRYLFRELAYTFFAVILVVLLISISNKFVRLISKAASGEIAPDVLFQLILFQIPDLAAFLLPIAFFLAILITLGRLFANNEIPVLFACGFSWGQLVRFVGIGSLIVAFFTALLTCYGTPKLAQYREQVLKQEGPFLLLQTMMPGRFHSFQKDKLVFYVGDMKSDRTQLKNIFIAEHPNASQPQGENWSVLTARSGKIVVDPKTGLTYLTLAKGKRYVGTPGEQDYSILRFQNYQRLIEEPVVTPNVLFHRTMATRALWQMPTPAHRAELQWRISLPLAAPLLALLALAFSSVSPRRGRFGAFFIAIVICIVYFNLLMLSKRWVALGRLPEVVGVWWVHLLLLLLGLFLLIEVSGKGEQMRYYFKKRLRA